MAEIAVINLLTRLTPLLLQELQLLSGVREKLDYIKDDLESMRAFLMDVDRRQDIDEGVKVWVKQVRELAYDIEDAVDKFLFAKGRPHRLPILGLIPSSLRYVRELIARHQLSVNVQSLLNRLETISRRRQSFCFTPRAVDMNTPRTFDMNLSGFNLQMTALFAEESQLVGIQSRRDRLVEKLLQDELKRVVISVVGMGGLGKTTLVRKVYEDRRLEVRFDCFAWITVSSSFRIEDLLRGMLRDFFRVRGSVTEEISMMHPSQLVSKLRNFLEKKSYLAVLDDIWTVEDWELIKCALPENEKGSRIIVTTRIKDVADFCSQSPKNVHNLQPLSKKEAWTLFCKKTFSSDSTGNCPSELEQTSKSILRICGGLPLAIVTIGGLLSTKRKTLVEWDRVRRSLSAELEHGDKLNSLKRILGLSYDDLPYHVKSCFLYFGGFPEDYIVSRAKLIRQWIAEGFISPLAGMSLEEVSEAKLDELVQRNLVQVVSSDSYGRVERCQVHDLMHWLILSKSKEQNFIILAQDKVQIHDRVRRLSVHTGHSFPEKGRLTHLRSLFVFGPRKELRRLSKFKMLKVLNLTGVPLDEIPTSLFDLFHLRYLNLRRTKICLIPESIRKLQNLQTLDIKYTDVRELPQEILNLLHIEHLLALCQQYGVKMPTGIGSLKALQKLYCLELAGEDQARELGKLTQLRTLSISGVEQLYMKALSDSIGKMWHLQSLFIGTKNEFEPEEVQTLLTSPFLRCFKLYGRIKKLPDMLGSLESLVKIKLGHCGLADDPFKVLQFLPSLVDLRLRDTYNGGELSCDTGGFQKLKILIIRGFSQLLLVNIQEGALPNLASLTIRDCACLKDVPIGIEHLASLYELDLINIADDFLMRIRSEGGLDWDRVKHIPKIRNWHGDDGAWHREDIETPVLEGRAARIPLTPHWRIFGDNTIPTLQTPTRWYHRGDRS